MVKNLVNAALAFALTCIAPSAYAAKAENVVILSIDSPNQHGHIYVAISAPSNCPVTPQAYFIIRGWGEEIEPALTNRKAMLQLVLTAFSLGKNVTVTGADCYLDKYLFADQVTVIG
jgi:hypothetical protein